MTDVRDNLVHWMKQTVYDQSKYHNFFYKAVRPQEVRINYVSGMHVDLDCSDGCRFLCHLAGVPDDPAGNAYATYGNSSSIWSHLDHIMFAEAKPGDVVTFGKTGDHHACMIYDVSNPSDPDVWNLGTQGQPVFRKLSQEIAGHKGMLVTVCRLNTPVPPPPTSEDILRAKTGEWAWFAWRLGEGPWKHYGPANKKVRPSVPKLISPVWWKDFVGFLRARNKGNRATSK